MGLCRNLFGTVPVLVFGTVPELVWNCAILDVVVVEQYSFRYQENEIAAVLIAIQTSTPFTNC